MGKKYTQARVGNKRFKLRTCTVYLRGIDRNIKAYFKAHCARHNVTMAQKIEDMMRECIQADVKTFEDKSQYEQ